MIMAEKNDTFVLKLGKVASQCHFDDNVILIMVEVIFTKLLRIIH